MIDLYTVIHSYQRPCWPSLHTVVLYICDWSPVHDNPSDPHAGMEHAQYHHLCISIPNTLLPQ